MSYFNSQGLGSLNVCKRKKRKLAERDVNIEMRSLLENTTGQVFIKATQYKPLCHEIRSTVLSKLEFCTKRTEKN